MSNITSKLVNLAGNITGTLPIANGGTGQTTAPTAFNALSPMTTAGDVIYGGTSGAGTRLAAGTTSQVFVGGTTPSWGNVPAAALPTVTQSTKGAVASAGQLLGTNTNDDASAGNVGEFILSTANTNATTSSAYFDVTSITIPSAGDWDISAGIDYSQNGATFTSYQTEIAVSTTSGTSLGTVTTGYNDFNDSRPSVTLITDTSLYVPRYRVGTTTSTTYYLKGWIRVFTVGNPTAKGFISARRVR